MLLLHIIHIIAAALQSPVRALCRSLRSVALRIRIKAKPYTPPSQLTQTLSHSVRVWLTSRQTDYIIYVCRCRLHDDVVDIAPRCWVENAAAVLCSPFLSLCGGSGGAFYVFVCISQTTATDVLACDFFNFSDLVCTQCMGVC